jgi:RAQPRD family integrative conjugative element protein
MRAMRNTGPNPLRHVSILLAGILVSLAPLHLARADAAGEREQLARVIHELQALEPLLRAAQSQANPDARVRFRYDWLRQDLQRLRLGTRSTSTPRGHSRGASRRCAGTTAGDASSWTPPRVPPSKPGPVSRRESCSTPSPPWC